MKRNVILFAVILAAAALLVPATPPAGDAFPIGTKLEGFTMPDPGGKDHDYKALKGKNGTLVVFLSIQCPVVKMYDERINEIAAAYRARGINFVGIYSNHTEPVEDVKAYTEGKYGFPVLIDAENVFADRLGATKTPEVYYFGPDDTLEYHGAIDNDRTGRNISKEYLRTAFDEKLSKKEITEKETNAFGCSIKRVKEEG